MPRHRAETLSAEANFEEVFLGDQLRMMREVTAYPSVAFLSLAVMSSILFDTILVSSCIALQHVVLYLGSTCALFQC